MRKTFCLGFTLCLLSVPAFACTDAAAIRHVPIEILEGQSPEEISCNSAAATIGNRHYVGIAYSNGADGALVILELAAGETRTVLSASESGMLGSNPSVRTEDLDGDSAPEFVATFVSATANTRTWVYKIVDGKAQNLTPESDEQPGGIFEASFLDVDGDGVKEVLAQELDPTDEKNRVTRLYSLGTTRRAINVPFVQWFVREMGTPAREAATFPATKGDAEVLIVNGGAGGSPVASATILLNGVEIAAPSAFHNRVETIRRTVAIQGTNEIAVTLNGKEGDEVLVLVRPTP